MDSAALLMLNEQQIYLFGESSKTSGTGGQLYNDTSYPYQITEHYLVQM